MNKSELWYFVGAFFKIFLLSLKFYEFVIHPRKKISQNLGERIFRVQKKCIDKKKYIFLLGATGVQAKACHRGISGEGRGGGEHQKEPWMSVLRIQIRIIFGCRIRIRITKWKFRTLKAQNGAMEDRGRSQERRGSSKWSRGGSVDYWSHIRITLLRSRIQIRITVKTRIRWAEQYSEKVIILIFWKK